MSLPKLEPVVVKLRSALASWKYVAHGGGSKARAKPTRTLVLGDNAYHSRTRGDTAPWLPVGVKTAATLLRYRESLVAAAGSHAGWEKIRPGVVGNSPPGVTRS
jgi:hypothetical protein